MTASDIASESGSIGFVAVLSAFVGVVVLGYGVLLVPTSVLGGAWLAAVGLSSLLAGLFSTGWAGDRFGLSAADRRKLSLAFGLLAAFLLVAFVVVNFASFEPGGVETGP